MARSQINIRLNTKTGQQIAELAARTGMSKTTLITTAIDRYYREERGTMAKVLCVTDETVFGMYDELVGHYDDNGGEPDGPDWLPSGEGPDLDSDAVNEIIRNGQGKVVSVRYAKENAILDTITFDGTGRVVNQITGEAEDVDDSYIALLKADVDEMSTRWAHYGAYGTIDSMFVYVPR